MAQLMHKPVFLSTNRSTNFELKIYLLENRIGRFAFEFLVTQPLTDFLTGHHHKREPGKLYYCLHGNTEDCAVRGSGFGERVGVNRYCVEILWTNHFPIVVRNTPRKGKAFQLY